MPGYIRNIMDYTINRQDIYDLVDEEVSRAADDAYAEDGTPLFDSVVLTDKDRDAVDRHIGDGIRGITAAFEDIASYVPEDSTGQTTVPEKISFSVPDMDSSLEPFVQEELTRYIAMTACAAIFRQRRPALVEEYSNLALSSLEVAGISLRKRTAPTRTTS